MPTPKRRRFLINKRKKAKRRIARKALISREIGNFSPRQIRNTFSSGVLGEPISYLAQFGITSITADILWVHGIRWLRVLVEKTKEEISSIPQVGPTRLKSIEDALAKLNLSLQ